MKRYKPAQIRFLPERSHTITDMSDITHMDSSVAWSVNTRSKLTTT
jgi:hypothetical protein